MQSVHYLFCPMSSHYSQYTTSSAQVQSVHHLIWPCPVRITALLSISSQYTISLSHVKSVHYLSCPCRVSTPHLLPKSSQSIISSGYVQLKYHVFCPHPTSTPSLLDCLCPVSLSQLLNTQYAIVNLDPAAKEKVSYENVSYLILFV